MLRLFLQIILRKVLQNLNLQCDEAENGQIAVDLHKQGNVYDLVLMDKEMPVMDGHEATRQLRSMGVKTPIVALTGNALTTDRELFFEAGVDDFQTKVGTASSPLPFTKYLAAFSLFLNEKENFTEYVSVFSCSLCRERNLYSCWCDMELRIRAPSRHVPEHREGRL